MKDSKLEVNNSRLNEIKSQFHQFGISSEQYPSYTDPNAFGKTFKQYSLLKAVPLKTTDSSTNS
jgi:hypothetical protein